MLEEFDDRFGYGYDQGRPAPAAVEVLPAVRAESSGVPLSSLQSWEQLFGYLGAKGLSADRAMRHGAVYACVRIIAGSIAQLPFKTYKSQDDGTAIEVRGHPMARLLRLRPNPRMSAVMFWRSVLAQAVLNGNGYAWLERNRNGRIQAMWPLPKSRVSPSLSTSGLTKGRIIYAITLDDGSQITVDMDDMLHIPGSLEWNGLEAKSPLQAAASAVNVGLEANEFAQRYFENDATPPAVLKYAKIVTPTTADLIRHEWQDKGTGENRHKIRVISEGGELEQLEINAEDAQLLETRRFSVEDIARIWGVPPHMIGAIDKQTSWGSGIEQQGIGFVTYTLGMHIAATEQELEYKVFREDGHHCEPDVRALMRGDFKARTEGYRGALGGSAGPGFMSSNEVRRLENLPPVEGGDEVQKWTQGKADATSSPPAAGDESGGEKPPASGNERE